MWLFANDSSDKEKCRIFFSNQCRGFTTIKNFFGEQQREQKPGGIGEQRTAAADVKRPGRRRMRLVTRSIGPPEFMLCDGGGSQRLRAGGTVCFQLERLRVFAECKQIRCFSS